MKRSTILLSGLYVLALLLLPVAPTFADDSISAVPAISGVEQIVTGQPQAPGLPEKYVPAGMSQSVFADTSSVGDDPDSGWYPWGPCCACEVAQEECFNDCDAAGGTFQSNMACRTACRNQYDNCRWSQPV